MNGMSVLRPNQRGKSNLGGVTKILVYTIDQFTPDSVWPKRADVATGKSTVVPPLLTTPVQSAARIIIDLETGARFKGTGTGPSTNKTYVHQLLDAKVAGYTAEQGVSLDSIYNMPVVIVCVLADGTRVVLGSTDKPLTINDDSDSGAKSNDYKGVAITTEMTAPLDFRPVILDSTVTLAEATIPAYA